MKPLKIVLLATVYLLLNYSATDAQTWQWGKRGGSASSGSGGVDEVVVDMATDQNGNLYVLSNVLQTGLDVDGHAITNFGYQDVLLSSFKCDGTYRWSKIMGSNSQDLAIALQTDTLGGVYVMGSLTTNTTGGVHIDADASLPFGYKSQAIVKYDTAGIYQWHKFPQSDTITTASVLGTYFLDMDVDKTGNSYVLCELAPGLYSGSFVVPAKGIYILKHDKNGAFVSGHTISISSTMGGARRLKIRRDHINGKYIITGTLLYSVGTLTIGTTPIEHPMIVAYFSPTGSLLWLKQDTNDLLYASQFGRAAVDAAHNIYLGGTTSASDTFNGYLPVTAGSNSAPLVVAMDTMGNNIWARNAIVYGTTFCNTVALNGNEVIIAGQYPGKVKWASFPDSLSLSVGTIFDVFITRFNKNTGAVTDMDSLASAYGGYEDATSLTTDKHGNIYVGGNFNISIITGTTTLLSNGGGSDFFIAKYGYAGCSCVTPTASFTSTGLLTKTFTYTGTATYDSVRWDFGDGGTSTLASPTHTFAAGTYTVCVTVYTACGIATHCQTFTISPTTEIAGTAFEGLSIYPNPVSGQLYVDNIAQGTRMDIYNIVGRKVYETAANGAKMRVDMQALPGGNYIIQLTDKKGERMRQMLLKQ